MSWLSQACHMIKTFSAAEKTNDMLNWSPNCRKHTQTPSCDHLSASFPHSLPVAELSIMHSPNDLILRCHLGSTLC